MAWRPPADRSRVGVRGARPGISVYPWGDAFDIDRANVINSVAPKPVEATRPGSAGSAPTTCRERDGVGLGLAGGRLLRHQSATTDRASDRHDQGREGRLVGSNEFVARSAYRHYEDPPTTATSTSASGSPRSDRDARADRRRDGRRRLLDGAREPAARRSRPRPRPGGPRASIVPESASWGPRAATRRATSRTSTPRSRAEPRRATSRCSSGPWTTSRASCSTRTSSMSVAATPRTCSRSGGSTGSTARCERRGSPGSS